MAENETPNNDAAAKPAARKVAKKPVGKVAAAKTPVKPSAKAPVKPVARKAAAAKPAAAKPAPAKVVAAQAAPVPEATAPGAPAAPEPATESTPSVEAAVPAPAPEPVASEIPTEIPTAPVASKATATKAEEKPAKAGAGPKVAKPKAATKTASRPIAPAFAGLLNNFMLEDTTMDMSANLTSFQDAMAQAQTKAKEAFEKGTTMMGEASDFTKGNVEAVMESGKIFAEGLQSFGSELVSEGRTAFEAMSGDIKELAAAKSPTDFFKLQGDMMRKNFDSAVATSSKNSEAMLKLMSDAFAPISGRVSMAMEKARTTTAL